MKMQPQIDRIKFSPGGAFDNSALWVYFNVDRGFRVEIALPEGPDQIADALIHLAHLIRHDPYLRVKD